MKELTIDLNAVPRMIRRFRGVRVSGGFRGFRWFRRKERGGWKPWNEWRPDKPKAPTNNRGTR